MGVYISLHQRFDASEEVVYTRMKNGKNRRVLRGATGKIYAANDGREVVPEEMLLIVLREIASRSNE